MPTSTNQLTNYSPAFMGWDVEALKAAIDDLMTPAIVAPTPLKAFSTNFSNLPIPSGVINVPIQTWPTTANSNAGGVTINNATASSAQLVLNKDMGNFYQFNPAEVQQYGMGYAINSWIRPAIYGNDRFLASASLAVALTGGNFPSASVKFATSGSFTPAGVGQLNSQLSQQGINGERFAVLVPDYYWNVQSSVAVLGNQAGADAIYNTLKGMYKMNIVEGQDLPSISGVNTALTSSIVGFSGNAAGIAVGTALPPIKHPSGEMFPYTSPWTGVTYLIEHYYDEHARAWIIGASFIYDVEKIQNTIRVLYSL